MEITEQMVAGYITAVITAIRAAGHQLHDTPSYLADPEEPISATIRIADPGEGGSPIELTWEPEEGGAVGQGWSVAVYDSDTSRSSMHTDLRLGVVVAEEVVAEAVTAILATGSFEAGRVVPDIAGQLAPYATWPNQPDPPGEADAPDDVEERLLLAFRRAADDFSGFHADELAAIAMRGLRTSASPRAKDSQ